MIFPNQPQSTDAVATHYDELDLFYRDVWGEHVHHGYWRTGQETAGEATEALVHLVATQLDLSPGHHVCDIGCGYGATARLLADREYVTVTGVTVSPAQAAQALPTINPKILVQDWLTNDFPDASFDRAYAIESSEHMPDKQQFFIQAARTLKPNGRLVICAWLSRERPKLWEIRHLLEPICREGRLPHMGDETDYRTLAETAGLRVLTVEDISKNVRRTWSICLRRMLAGLLTDPRYLRYLLNPKAKNRIFAVTMVRILIAYQTGSMRYCVMTFQKA
jgi:tocopherol O-methyltransferase